VIVAFHDFPPVSNVASEKRHERCHLVIYEPLFVVKDRTR